MKYLFNFLIIYLISLIEIAVIPGLGLGRLELNFFVVFLVAVILSYSFNQALICGFVMALIIESVSAFTYGSVLLIFVLAAVIFNYFFKKSNQKLEFVNLLVFSLIILIIYELDLFLLRNSLAGNAGFLEGLKNNLFRFLWELFKGILSNGLILVPLFYYFMKKFNEIFESLETRRKM